MKNGKLVEVTFREGGYRQGHYIHPNKDFYNHNYSVWFRVRDLDVIEGEMCQEDYEFYSHRILKTRVTLHSRHERLKEHMLLPILKKQCSDYYNIRANNCENADRWICGGPDYGEVSHDEVRDTIKLLTPRVVTLSIDNIDILDTYRYQYYSAMKFLDNLLIEGAAYDCAAFYRTDTQYAPASFLEWCN